MQAGDKIAGPTTPTEPTEVQEAPPDRPMWEWGSPLTTPGRSPAAASKR